MTSQKELPIRVKESIDSSKATYKQLGKSGLRVSVPIFGAMSFGASSWGAWVIEEDKVGSQDWRIHRGSGNTRSRIYNSLTSSVLDIGSPAAKSCL